MHILHVIAGAEVGGAETYAQDAILALHERGIGQTVLTRSWPRVMARYATAGVDARLFRFSPLDRLFGPRRIRQIAAEIERDVRPAAYDNSSSQS